MSTLRYLILGTLHGGSPQHGYAIMKIHRRRSGMKLNPGNVYREMSYLLADGLVRAVPNPPNADRRRIPFQLTEKGTGAFEAWLRSRAGVQLGVYSDGLSERVPFLYRAEPPLRNRLLACWCDELRKRMSAVEHARDAALSPAEHDPDARCRALELSRRLRHLVADLEFLDELVVGASDPPRPLIAPWSRPVALRTSTPTAAYGPEASHSPTSDRHRRRPSSASP